MSNLPSSFKKELMDLIARSTTNGTINPQSINQNANQPKKTPDELLFDLATVNRNLYFDKSLRTYVEIEDVKLQQAINTRLVRIESAEFRKWLKREYRINYKKVMSNKALIEAIQDEVSEEARINGEEITIHNRIAHENDAIYLDLGTRDRCMVKVTKKGWEIGKYKVFFKRHDQFAELPIPVSGGKITDILEFLPKMPDEDVCLILSWLIASYFSDIERAFLLIEGEHGFGKTRIAKLLKSFIDPSHNMVLTYNDNINEVAQQIDHNCLPIFDNVSNISKKVSDLICGAFSESSHVKRKLFTDEGDFPFNLSGNVMFTTIKLENAKKDLLNRCYKIFVKRNCSFYESKQILTKKLESVKPQIFGAILDILAATMNKVEEMPTRGYHRTVDFDRHALAAAIVMGFGANMFNEARKNCERLKITGLADNTPLIEALTNFLLSNNNVYTGYMSRLVKILPGYTVSPENIPKAPQVLSKKLGMIRTELKAAGISVINKGNDHKGNKYLIALTNQLQQNDLQQHEESGQFSENQKTDYAISPNTLLNSNSDNHESSHDDIDDILDGII